ncbi:MAG TPA: hypothetical protein VHC69_35160 [Polyangiaceae bacterium]|nr:hypothetical protein [Polyangiaceae bacterium]
MNVFGKLDFRLRPIHARILLVVGLLLSFLPLSRKTPRQQTVVLDVPERFRDGEARVDVSWTRNGDTEPLGGFTMTFPEGAPASLRREISAPDGKYRLDVSLERSRKRGPAGGGPVCVEFTRQLSLNGGEVRVLLEDTPP